MPLSDPSAYKEPVIEEDTAIYGATITITVAFPGVKSDLRAHAKALNLLELIDSLPRLELLEWDVDGGELVECDCEGE